MYYKCIIITLTHCMHNDVNGDYQNQEKVKGTSLMFF